jgi:hypothetical protein
MIGNTAIDLSIFTLELPLVLSNVLAWLVAVSCSPYVIEYNDHLPRRDRPNDTGRDHIRFVLTGIPGVLATTTTAFAVNSHFIWGAFGRGCRSTETERIIARSC